MPLQKLTSTDAFMWVDLPDAPATGTVRRAKKILQSSAKELARSATYGFASFEIQRSGASGGINAVDEQIDDAVAAFNDELKEAAAGGALHLNPGKGLSFAELATLTDAANRPPVAGSPFLTAIGAVAATAWALDGIAGKRIAVEGAGTAPEASAIESMVTDSGATLVTPDGLADKPWLIWSADADAIICGSKPAALTHQGSSMVTASAVVPWGPVPVTTKAFVDLRSRGIELLPDFISAAGGLVAEYLPESAGADETTLAEVISSRIPQHLDRHAGHRDGLLLGACQAAEEFIASWSEVPFGRPLAA